MTTLGPIELKLAHYRHDPEAALIEIRALEKENERLRVILRQLNCDHRKTRGGNDYLSCDDCGFEWDYRRETAATALGRVVRKALEAK
jgi:hypothetical protein